MEIISIAVTFPPYNSIFFLGYNCSSCSLVALLRGKGSTKLQLLQRGFYECLLSVNFVIDNPLIKFYELQFVAIRNYKCRFRYNEFFQNVIFTPVLEKLNLSKVYLWEGLENLSSTVWKQIVQYNRLIDNAGVLTSGNAHRRNHHQLDAVRLVVHLACGKSLYFIQLLFRETSVYYKTDSQTQNRENRGSHTTLYCHITPKIMKNSSEGAKLG